MQLGQVVSPVHPGPAVLLETQALLVHRAVLDQEVFQEHQDLQEHKVAKVIWEHQVLRVQQEPVDLLVLQDPKETPDLLDLLDSEDNLDQQEIQVHKNADAIYPVILFDYEL